MRPNLSRVQLTKIPGRTGASSHSRKEKKVSATQKLCGSTKDTPVRLISWSKPIRDSEGRTPPPPPPLIGRGPDIPVCVCARWQMRHCVLLQSDREKEVSSRDACSVANLARFSAFVDPHSNFLFSKKSNLWQIESLRVSLWSPQRRHLFCSVSVWEERVQLKQILLLL